MLVGQQPPVALEFTIKLRQYSRSGPGVDASLCFTGEDWSTRVASNGQFMEGRRGTVD